MPIYNAQVILPFFTNLPGDVIQNNFHFVNSLDSHADVADHIDAMLTAFYTTVYGSSAGDRVNYIDWTLAYIKVFNLDDPTPRVPEIRPMTFVAGSATSTVPTEVACVLSFHAAPESGVRFQRLYNRVFLGGLKPANFTASAIDNFPRFSSTFVTAVQDAAEGLCEPGGGDNTTWVQLSRATGLLIPRAIVGGWVDDGPDTQRRRSVLAASRNTWVNPDL